MSRPGINKMFTEEFQRNLVEYFTSNKVSIQKTADHFNINWSSTRIILLRAGLDLDDKKRYTESQQIDIVNRYYKGQSTTKIKRDEKVDVNTIIKILKKYHVVMRDNKPVKGRTWLDPEYKPKLVARMTGDKNMKWKGGTTPLISKIRASAQQISWRKDVFERDNFTCRYCKISYVKDNTVNLEAHHIVFLDDIIKKNNIKSIKEAMSCPELWDISNGVCLCKRCHSELHIFLKTM